MAPKRKNFRSKPKEKKFDPSIRKSKKNFGRNSKRKAEKPDIQSPDIENPDVVSDENFGKIFDIETEVKPFFLEILPFEEYSKAQEINRFRFLAAISALGKNKVQILQGSKVRALAAAWTRHDHDLAAAFLQNSDLDFGVVEILKALQILDAKRKATEVEKKFAKLENEFATAGQKGKTRLGRKIATLKLDFNNLNKMKLTTGSVSGALARHIKRWTRQIPKDRLEFFALHMPKNTWKQLADLCHLNPEKDFPQLPWFLRYCFDESVAPTGSLVQQCQGLNEKNVNEFLSGIEIPYSAIKQYAGSLREFAKARIATFTPEIDTLLWNYEDLQCEKVDKIIDQRLKAGESVSLPYGKLMERMLMLRKIRAGKEKKAEFYPKLLPFAEKMLKNVRIPVESPVVVIGDASGSMEVAIETSTIIASFLRALTNAQLVFFSDQLIEPKFIPKTIEEVLELALVTKTVASTCHAAGLWQFYERKEIVKTFIITTDEEENAELIRGKEKFNFLKLFKRYHSEVYPARLVFVSFLHNQHAQSQMVPSLIAEGFQVIQFKLDHQRPDLTKLDNLVGQLAMESDEFPLQVNALEEQLRREGLQPSFERLKLQAEAASLDFELI